MTHRSFGAGGPWVGVVAVMILLAGCAASEPAHLVTAGATNLGIPTRDAPHRTSIVVDGTGTAAPLPREVLNDLSTLATGTGESLDEVASRQLGRTEFRALMDAVEAQDSDILVTWGYENDAAYGAWVLFNEDPPEETLATLRRAPLDVLVETGVATDQAELDRVSESITGTLDAVDGLTVTGTTTDLRTATVTVSVLVRDSTVDVDSAKRTALQKALRVSLDDELPGPVIFDESPVITDTTVPAFVSPKAADGTLLVVGDYVRGGAGLQALVSGEVGVSPQGCITVGGITVVAPRGSGFLPNGRVALTYLGDYAIGEPIDESSGGYILYGKGGRAIPAGFEKCGAGEYAVLQP